MKYPKVQNFSYFQNSGGFVNHPNPTMLQDSQSPRCFDIDFYRLDILKRNGYIKMNDTQIGGSGYPIKGMGVFERISGSGVVSATTYTTGQSHILISLNTALYTFNKAGGTTTDLKTLEAAPYWTSTVKTGFISMNDNIYYGNGVEVNRIWDGNAVAITGVDCTTSVMGMVAPTSAPTATVNATGGNLLGNYYYKVSFVNIYGIESNTGTVSGLVSPSGEQVDLTGIPISGDNLAAKRYIYRTSANGGQFFYVDEISNNTATTYTDNIADTSLGSLEETDHNVPPKCNMFTMKDNRMWMAGDTANKSRLYYSTPDYPEYVGGNNFIDINKDDGDDITGIAGFFDMLIVFKNNSCYIVTGNSVDTYTVQKLSFGTGCVSHESIVDIGSKLCWTANDGFYTYDGSTLEKVSSPIDAEFVSSGYGVVPNLSPNSTVTAINNSMKSQYWALMTASGVYSPYEKAVVVWDYANNIYSIYTMPMEYLVESKCKSVFPTGTLQPQVFGGYKGFIFQMDTGTSNGTLLFGSTDGTLKGNPTSGTNTTVQDTSAAFFTTGSGLKGCWIGIESVAGSIQYRQISSNTATGITFAPDVFIAPSSTDTYFIGGIGASYDTKFIDFGAQDVRKRIRSMSVEGLSNNTITMKSYMTLGADYGAYQNERVNTMTLTTDRHANIWGFSRVGRRIKLRFMNPYPAEPFEIEGFTMQVQGLDMRDEQK